MALPAAVIACLDKIADTFQREITWNSATDPDPITEPPDGYDRVLTFFRDLATGHQTHLQILDGTPYPMGTSLVDIAKWNPQTEAQQESGLTDSWTASTLAFTTIGSVQTFTPPADWVTYDLQVNGMLRGDLSSGDEAYLTARFLVEGAASVGVPQVESNPLAFDASWGVPFLGTWAGLSGAVDCQPDLFFSANTGTVSVTNWWADLLAVRVT